MLTNDVADIARNGASNMAAQRETKKERHKLRVGPGCGLLDTVSSSAKPVNNVLGKRGARQVLQSTPPRKALWSQSRSGAVAGTSRKTVEK